MEELRCPEARLAPPEVVIATEPPPPSLVDRYFTRWYKADVKGKPCEDHCILQHSNRICVITLAGSHPVLQSGKIIKSISYQISNNCSRLQNKVSGKFKRGAQFLTELAPLCKIYCSDGEEYTISSCVRGRLMEVNESILQQPSLLQEKDKTAWPKATEELILAYGLRELDAHGSRHKKLNKHISTQWNRRKACLQGVPGEPPPPGSDLNSS